MSVKRPWYQLYLSTLMVVFLECGALLGLNMLHAKTLPGTQKANLLVTAPTFNDAAREHFSYRFVGWPLSMYGWIRFEDGNNMAFPGSGKVFEQDPETGKWNSLMLGVSWENLSTDLFVWFGLLAFTILFMEWRHRGIPWSWFRMSLPAALCMLLLLAALAWLNLRTVILPDDVHLKGWPLAYHLMDGPENVNGLPDARGFHPAWLLVDLAAALGGLAFAAFFLKRIFKRPAPPPDNAPAPASPHP